MVDCREEVGGWIQMGVKHNEKYSLEGK